MKSVVGAFILFVTATPGYAAQSNSQSDWLVFLSAENQRPFGIDSSLQPDPNGEYAAQILFNHTYGALHLLVESEVSNDDSGIDRLQIGWQIDADNSLWLGKFHQPASSWNFGHDHGHYLQTAISVPSIEAWEDDGGLLPQSTVGALLDSEHRIGSAAGLQLATAAGFAPTPTPEDPHRYWIPLVPGHGHQLSWSGRATFYPTYLGDRGIGVLLARQRMQLGNLPALTAAGWRQADESVCGAFADWGFEPWRLLASLYNVDLVLRGGGSQHAESFIAGYVQIERHFGNRWTLFARREDSSRIQDSIYVSAFGDRLPIQKSLAGLRWEFTPRQAITVEAARVRTTADTFYEARLQWSAVIR